MRTALKTFLNQSLAIGHVRCLGCVSDSPYEFVSIMISTEFPLAGLSIANGESLSISAKAVTDGGSTT